MVTIIPYVFSFLLGLLFHVTLYFGLGSFGQGEWISHHLTYLYAQTLPEFFWKSLPYLFLSLLFASTAFILLPRRGWKADVAGLFLTLFLNALGFYSLIAFLAWVVFHFDPL